MEELKTEFLELLEKAKAASKGDASVIDHGCCGRAVSLWGSLWGRIPEKQNI